MKRAAPFVLAALSSCIVPDRDIRIDPGLDNEGAVRIVQRAPRVPDMDEFCNAEKPDSYELANCPEVRRTQPSGLLRARDGGSFCVCPGGDKRALDSFEIYAEDGDVEGDRAQDTIYGVALLDLDNSTMNPEYDVGYQNYWAAGLPGERISVGENVEDNRTQPPIGRESTQLSVFPLDDGTGRIDLCNNDNGGQLLPGLHDLRFMVTDRPFFRPRRLDLDGDPAVDANGDPLYLGPVFGMPDLAAGATYAVIDYVFECKDAALDAPNCEQDPPPPGPGEMPIPRCVCDCAATEDG